MRAVWGIDPQARLATTHAPDGTARVYGDDADLPGGDILPGFAVSLAELFA